MSVSHKVFVESSDIKSVAQSVTKALNEYVRAELDKTVEKSEFENRFHYTINNDDFTNGIRSAETYDFESFRFFFTVHGEVRMLWMHTYCSCDVRDYTDNNVIIFSLDHWGLHKQIMNVVIEALKPFGNVWQDEDDCDDSGYEMVLECK